MGIDELPDDFDEQTYEVKVIMLSHMTAEDLRNDIDRITKIERSNDNFNQFSKDEMAAVILALGGPTDKFGDE